MATTSEITVISANGCEGCINTPLNSAARESTEKGKGNDLFSLDPYLSEDPSGELQVIEAEVARVSANLSRLVMRMHALKERVNERNSLFIRLLPPEIVAEIFLFCIPNFHHMDDDDSLSLTQNTSMPLRLGAVCASWRRIAWSAPKLWCSIVFHLASAVKLPAQVVLLDEWLSRAGQLPLSIRMGANEEIVWTNLDGAGMMEVVGKYSLRWCDLDFRLPSTVYKYLPTCDNAANFPFLRSIIFRPPGGQGDRVHRVNLPCTPKLRELSLSCLYLRSVAFQLEFLTHLELESFYVDETLEMLRQSTSLVSFSAKKILGGDDRHPIPEEAIVLPSLENLCLINDKGADLPLFFQKITTPKLRTFSYMSDVLQNLPWADVVSLVKRSSCEIESLSVEKSPITEEQLQLLLSSMPTLTSLVLNMPVVPGTVHAPLTDKVLQAWDAEFALSNKLSCVLPRLKSFAYHGAQGFTWPVLLRVLESRCALPESKDPGQAAGSSKQTMPQHNVSCIEYVNVMLAFETSEESMASARPDPDLLESLENRGVKVVSNATSRVISCSR
ncbi:hypothetical protein D9613_011629 [Agrocybe pediades]|uniref:F-box domain-containing protein n=1 Tax=Agrocybe pediades TaxID=84607 RepID=A0A8H4VQE9_9AGAR|nr:hypothetical protein D9613_011629 [Agrocybe pediades]